RRSLPELPPPRRPGHQPRHHRRPEAALTALTVLAALTAGRRPGSHQFAFPRSSIRAGTRTRRITVAAMSTAAASPIPICFTDTSGVRTEEQNTTIMIAAAAEMIRRVLVSPRDTAAELFPLARYSSRTLDSRNTS